MTPEREAELFRKLDLILNQVNELNGDVREMKGQQSIMLAWLQSMDQRFGALMAPVAPPKKPAA